MTWHRPIFNAGIFGKANRVVTNGWTDSAGTVRENSEGIKYAQTLVVQPQIIAQQLCEVVSAASLAANRWTYTVKIWVPPSIAGAGVAAMTDDRFSFTTCRNLREEHNTATLVDGMDITTPASSIGPVGSTWTGTAWTTTALEAKCLVNVVYDLGGNAYAFFDRPNPIRCTT